MVILLGASGYIGRAFSLELERRGLDYLPLSRNEINYLRFDDLLKCIITNKAKLVVNAAGFTGRPNVDACEKEKAETLRGNTLLAQTVAHACVAADVPWGHVSSGCIFSGAKITQNNKTRIEVDLTKPEVKALISRDRNLLGGFNEKDEPNFTFRSLPCSFYSGTKALAEEVITDFPRGYVWRLRIPFDEFNNPRNYLSKLQSYQKVYSNVNSLSHRTDFVCACLDLWGSRSPYGIYNVTNPGFVTTEEVVEMIQETISPKREFEFWENDEDFYKYGGKTPRSNCVLDVSKLVNAGVFIRPVQEALYESIQNWKP